jgi:hypothetical protein
LIFEIGSGYLPGKKSTMKKIFYTVLIPVFPLFVLISVAAGLSRTAAGEDDHP